ncbi:hypothetical protein [Vibrio genomosp. F10]|uniref:hypothetical protein n=1 Tax=Vibrio genomosp. F10 TaxID=723171 RepID=UPI00031F7221|nr:hypothetical protein [Vibrio genomosp. F10]OEF07262.1 hypothetical protein A1QI_17925 [Vibrio genomosp. F10 str. 9ZB36]
MRNPTINQHFISRAEQYLNASNPSAKARNRNIYSYGVTKVDSENFDISEAKKVGVSNNLSDLDLYSFEVLDKKVRLNFENEFGNYESNIEKWSVSLINKVNCGASDVSEELQMIFKLKFLNAIRSPYSFKETLSFFKMLINLYPTDKDLKEIYDRIDTSNKPHMSSVCKRYGFTEKEYILWLKLLYMVLYVKDTDGVNVLEAIVKSFYEKPENYIQVVLCTYTKGQAVLLSDKSFNQFDDTSVNINYEFNLNSVAHLSYSFIDITKALPNHPLHGNKRVLDAFRAQKKEINLTLCNDNNELLLAYNTRTIFQCHDRVFCKVDDFAL